MNEKPAPQKPGILAQILFVLFLGTWIAVYRKLLAPSIQPDPNSLSLLSALVAAVGGAFFGVLGMGVGMLLERAKRK